MSFVAAAELQAAMLRRGAFAGRYTDLREIGESGVINRSVALGGVDMTDGRRVVLKVRQPELLSAFWRRSFQREGRILRMLAPQPGVVTALATNQRSIVTLRGRLVVLEYHVLERGRGHLLSYGSGLKPPRGLLAALRSMCLTIAAVHESGVVHRDVKPTNFVHFRADGIKLIDFGASSILSEPPSCDEASTFSRYSYPFSRFHAAPELYCGLGRNRSMYRGADIFGLGASVYELWTGRRLMTDLFAPDTTVKMFRAFAGVRDAGLRLTSYRGMIEKIIGCVCLPKLAPVRGRESDVESVSLLDDLYRELAALDWRLRPSNLRIVAARIERHLQGAGASRLDSPTEGGHA